MLFFRFSLQTVAPSLLEARMRSDVEEIHSQNVSHRFSPSEAETPGCANQYNQTNCNSVVLLLVLALILFVKIK